MYGKLGHGNENGHPTPSLVETMKGLYVRQVACGSRHTVVLLENQDVYTWGDKENGVSGHGDTNGHQYSPTCVSELVDKKIKQISACGFHTAALSGTCIIYLAGLLFLLYFISCQKAVKYTHLEKENSVVLVTIPNRISRLQNV